MAAGEAAPGGRDHVDRVLGAWKEECPELETSPAAVMVRLRRLMAFLGPEMDDVLAEFGLTRPSFDALAALRRSGPPYRLSQRDLMDLLMRSSGTVSVRIDRLEKAGLVEREPDPADRRGVLVALTGEGREVIDAALPAHLENEERLLSALGEEERDALALLLRKLLVSFEGRSEGAPARRLGVAVAAAHVARRMRRAVGLPGRPGLLVRGVEAESPAARAGLGEGDLIVEADGREIRSVPRLRRALAETGPEEEVTLKVLRGVEEREVVVVLS